MDQRSEIRFISGTVSRITHPGQLLDSSRNANDVEVTEVAMSRFVARSALLYLGAVNLGAAGLFGYDKLQAERGAWRVSEHTLCQSATLGGWAGGLLAMQTFRHKTRKRVRHHASNIY